MRKILIKFGEESAKNYAWAFWELPEGTDDSAVEDFAKTQAELLPENSDGIFVWEDYDAEKHKGYAIGSEIPIFNVAII
jgi:hypothetical protein